jgi:hypothetical protein
MWRCVHARPYKTRPSRDGDVALVLKAGGKPLEFFRRHTGPRVKHDACSVRALVAQMRDELGKVKPWLTAVGNLTSGVTSGRGVFRGSDD